MSVYLPIHLSLSVFPRSINPSSSFNRLSIEPSIHQSIVLSIHPSMHLSIRIYLNAYIMYTCLIYIVKHVSLYTSVFFHAVRTASWSLTACLVCSSTLPEIRQELRDQPAPHRYVNWIAIRVTWI